MDRLERNAQTYDQQFNYLKSALELEKIPDHLRTHYAFFGMLNATKKYHKKHYQFFREHKTIKDTWDPKDDRLRVLDLFMEAPHSDSKGRLKSIHKLIEKPLTRFALSHLYTIYIEMLAYGHEEEAESLRESISDWELDSGVNQTVTSIKLEYLKMKKAYEEKRDLNDALRKLITEKVGFEDAASEELSLQYNAEFLPYNISEKDEHAVLLREIQKGRVYSWMYRHWMALCGALDYSPANMDIRFRVAKVSLEKTEEDEARSFVVAGLSRIIDTDQKANRERIESGIAASLGKTESERSSHKGYDSAVQNNYFEAHGPSGKRGNGTEGDFSSKFPVQNQGRTARTRPCDKGQFSVGKNAQNVYCGRTCFQRFHQIHLASPRKPRA